MSELDELLQPTVVPEQERRLPWRVSSQFWVAFFSVPPAVAILAFFNARRLGAPVRKQQWIVLAGLVGTIAFVALYELSHVQGWSRSILRLGGRVLSVVLYLVLSHLQSEDDGRHQVFGSGQYAPMWIPGLLAALVGILAVVLIIATVRLIA